jgi:hypothetical protein
MKRAFVIFAICLLSSIARSQSEIQFKGGMLSTRCFLPVGGDFVMDLHITGLFVATVSVDCAPQTYFTGTVFSDGKVQGQDPQGRLLVGRIRQKNGYPTFVGRITGGPCTYKVQSVAGYF